MFAKAVFPEESQIPQTLRLIRLAFEPNTKFLPEDDRILKTGIAGSGYLHLRMGLEFSHGSRSVYLVYLIFL